MRRPFSPLRLFLQVVVGVPLYAAVFCLLFAMTLAHRIGTGEWPSKEGYEEAHPH